MDISSHVKPAILGAIAGAVAITIIGFGWAGWVTQGRTESDTNLRVVAALAPICVVQFQQGADAASRLGELRKVSSYDQASFVEKAGWATMPGSTSPGSGVAKACAGLLANLKL